MHQMNSLKCLPSWKTQASQFPNTGSFVCPSRSCRSRDGTDARATSQHSGELNTRIHFPPPLRPSAPPPTTTKTQNPKFYLEESCLGLKCLHQIQIHLFSNFLFMNSPLKTLMMLARESAVPMTNRSIIDPLNW